MLSAVKCMDIDGLARALGDKVRQDEPLANHTTFRIGGPADLFVSVGSLDELCKTITLARRYGVPYLILGQGANVLVSDRGVRGIVIKNNCDYFSVEEDDGGVLLYAESGALIRDVARAMVSQGVAGLEWAVDVPGTVGGAIVGNAGAYNSYVSDSLDSVFVLLPEGEQRWLDVTELGLGYRTSRLKERRDGTVVLAARFHLRHGDCQVLSEKAAGYTRRRQENQPTEPSAGSVFKRTEQYPAGFLIETAGLKGYRVGDAMVSPVHANFIVNIGQATAAQVWELIGLVRDTVREKFGITLELEIELVGEW